MHQEYVARRKVGHQIFGATAEPGDGLPLQARHKVLLKRKPQVLAAGFRFQNSRSLHDRLQAAADGLDFGQFGHAGSFNSESLVQVIGSSHSPYGGDVIAPLRRARYGPGHGVMLMDRPGKTTHFGFRDVPVEDKQTLVNDVFHSVARRYDLMNDLMSAGLHRVWKDIMVNTLNPPKTDAPFALLDVAGGTGDIAFRAAEAAGPGFQATVCDINSDMLSVGRERAAARHLDDRVSFVEGNAEALAFPIRSFDAYTIAFGIRNVPRIDLALSEAFRVLKPGGRFLCLEFSTVDVPGLDRIYDLFSFKVIPPLGRAVTGDAESYQYLVESIRKFPKPNAFAEMIPAPRFSRVTGPASAR